MRGDIAVAKILKSEGLYWISCFQNKHGHISCKAPFCVIKYLQAQYLQTLNILREQCT